MSKEVTKYVIEIPDDISFNPQFLTLYGVEPKGDYVRTYDIEMDEAEELNSDYINEHFGDLQETAYQRGLDDAWECARELYLNGACKDLFGEYFNTFIKNYTAQEAIAKLKAYEEKQKADDKIEVGDEVNWLGDCFIVTRIFQPRNGKEQCDGIDDDGCVYHDVLIKDLEKTGRHFDIQKILEEMRND